MTVEAQTLGGKRASGQAAVRQRPWIGPGGYLFLLLWTLALVLLAPAERTFLAAGVALAAGLLCHHRRVAPARGGGAGSNRARLRTRWLFLACLMLLPALISAVEMGPGRQPRLTSWAPVAEGARLFVRALVIMVAVNGFAGAVSIAEIAAFFERAGVRGLGFALGVAANLLPILQQTVRSTWDSMRMRGGFRRHRRHHLRLFLTTLVYTTLRRAEVIALAAETRAYAPEKSHPAPLPRGTLDLALVVAGSGLGLLLLLS